MQIAYIEFTVASGDTGDVRLDSVVTSQTVTSGTLPNADLNTVVFVSDGAPNRSLDDFGAVNRHELAEFDRPNPRRRRLHQRGRQHRKRRRRRRPGPGVHHPAVGIDLDGGSLAFLANVEGPGNDGATNVDSAAQMSAVIGALSQGQTLADAAGSDVIEANAGSDIIFGDVLFTDDLADAAGLNLLPDGSGWAVFQTLEGTSPGFAGSDPAGDGAEWTRDDTIQYIKNNPLALARGKRPHRRQRRHHRRRRQRPHLRPGRQ